MDRGVPGSTGGWTLVHRDVPGWCLMELDEPGVFPVVFDMSKRTVVNLGGPGRGARPGWTALNRVEPCWHRRSTGKDREGSWRCRRWPGSTGMEKNEPSTPGGQRFTDVLPAPTVSPCCNTVQLGYKSVLFILHFHLAGMNRGEPGRTVAPPLRTGKNRSITGVLPAWTCVNRGEPAREPGWTV